MAVARKESQLSADKKRCADLAAQLITEFGVGDIETPKGQEQVSIVCGCTLEWTQLILYPLTPHSPPVGEAFAGPAPARGGRAETQAAGTD